MAMSLCPSLSEVTFIRAYHNEALPKRKQPCQVFSRVLQRTESVHHSPFLGMMGACTANGLEGVDPARAKVAPAQHSRADGRSRPNRPRQCLRERGLRPREHGRRMLHRPAHRPQHPPTVHRASARPPVRRLTRRGIAAPPTGLGTATLLPQGKGVGPSYAERRVNFVPNLIVAASSML